MFDIEFNPKENFLKEQLEVSGLEMKLFGIGAGAENRRRVQEENAQQRKLNKQARSNYDYAKDVHKAEKKDYYAQREFAYETAITNWEYGKQIQDYQYAQSLASYEKSAQIYEGQLDYNKQATSLAVSDQQASIQDLALSQAFQREAMHSDLMNEIKKGGIQKLQENAKLYGIKSDRRINNQTIQQNLNEITNQNTFAKEAKFVEGLKESGKAALGQAGVSRKKTLQSTAAETFRSLVALDSSLSGSRNKAAVDLLKVYVDAAVGETQVGLNLDMIELGINAAKDEVKFNNRVLEANMQSAIGQMGRNIQQIQLQKMGSDLQAEANLNIFPEEFDYAPEPQLAPERTFIKPVKQEAGTVPRGPRRDFASELIGDVAKVASFAMGPGGAAIGNFFAAAPAIGAGLGTLAGGSLGAGGGSMFGGSGLFGGTSPLGNLTGSTSSFLP